MRDEDNHRAKRLVELFEQTLALSDGEYLRLELLWNEGLRYRKNVRMDGTLDIVFSGRKVAVFLDPCFFLGITVAFIVECPNPTVRPLVPSRC